MVKGKIGKFENPEENLCLGACVLGKNENIVATLDPNTYTAQAWFAKGLAKGKLGGIIDDR